jgi:hypothetical protein
MLGSSRPDRAQTMALPSAGYILTTRTNSTFISVQPAAVRAPRCLIRAARRQPAPTKLTAARRCTLEAGPLAATVPRASLTT